MERVVGDNISRQKVAARLRLLKGSNQEGVIKLNSASKIKRFFNLEGEEANLVKDLLIHKSMLKQGLRLKSLEEKAITHRLYAHSAGIYLIFCTENFRPYIGRTVDIPTRLGGHASGLKGKRHGNRHLQNAFNEYGTEKFLFMQLEVVEDESRLAEREDFWAKHYRVEEIGFNIAPTSPTAPKKRVYGEEIMGERNGNATLKNCEVAAICKYLNEGTYGTRELAKMYKVTPRNIALIRAGKRRKQYTENLLSDNVKAKYWA